MVSVDERLVHVLDLSHRTTSSIIVHISLQLHLTKVRFRHRFKLLLEVENKVDSLLRVRLAEID